MNLKELNDLVSEIDKLEYELKSAYEINNSPKEKISRIEISLDDGRGFYFYKIIPHFPLKDLIALRENLETMKIRLNNYEMVYKH